MRKYFKEKIVLHHMNVRTGSSPAGVTMSQWLEKTGAKKGEL